MRAMLFTLTMLAASPVLAQQPSIVADTPITASLIRQVAGDLAPVQVLLPKGASAHHHQMRPSDARGLQDADLLVWTGPELTPWLERAVETVASDVPQVRLLTVPGTHLRDYAGDDQQDHDHHATDPHAWLDPDNARLWLTAIAERLAQADPDNAAAYAQNAEDAAQRIADMDARLQGQLAPHAGESFVVFHDAYGYFTDHFGLSPALAVSLGDASAPSAARLSQLRARIAQSGATCAFPEHGSNPKPIQSVIEGTTVRMGGELAPEGTGAESPGDAWFLAMQGLADTILACLRD